MLDITVTDDRHHGAEYFILCRWVLVVWHVENGRFEKVTGTIRALAPRNHRRACVDREFHITFAPLCLRFADDWTHGCFGVGRIADLQISHAGSHRAQHFGFFRFGNEDSGAEHTALPRMRDAHADCCAERGFDPVR